jgi:hypothetical protein
MLLKRLGKLEKNPMLLSAIEPANNKTFYKAKFLQLEGRTGSL